MRRLLATVSLSALAIAGALPEAMAYLKAGPPMAGPGHHRLKTSGGGTPPLDGFAAPSGAYSFRKLRSAYAGNAVRLRRASDNAELDIGFVGFVPGLGSPLDVAVANTHCASTTCFIPIWYGQSDAVRNLVQSTPASQFQLIFNCQGSLPCARTTGAQDLTMAGTVTPATGVVSMSAVADRVSGTGLCTHRQNGSNNRMGATSGAANSWSLAAGSALSVTANDNTWHAAQGVINGAGTVINIDGVETTGSFAGSVAVGAHQIVGVAATTCNFAEFIIWDNYPLTVGERAALRADQKSFWGTP